MGCKVMPMVRLIVGLMMLFASPMSANAHALEPGYLDLRQLTSETSAPSANVATSTKATGREST